MFLYRFHIKNFRCIKELNLEFNSGVNILIGENNSGKSSVIDALRICLSYTQQWRDIYVSQNDFYIDKYNPTNNVEDIEFHLHYLIENEYEAGIFNDMLFILPDGQAELQLHFRYYIDEVKGLKKVKYRVWGGENEGQMVSQDVFDLIYYVYLGALRDAVHSLRPRRGNKLGELCSKIETDEEKKKEMAGKLHDQLNSDESWRNLIELGRKKVNEHLNETSISGKEQNVLIEFLPFEFRKIVDSLMIQMPVYNQETLPDGVTQKFFEINQNGLGFNNLIYTAVILGDLKRRKEVVEHSYVALLIEEPEAHLHPQLQNIFFNYLNKLNNIGFQIFTTSHSPTVTAKSDLDSLIVLQDQQQNINSFSLINSELNENNKIYLQKFLDVTKSQLFFSNGCILVEGISEALLLPIFSIIISEKYSQNYDIEKNGIEVININGVSFEHFAKLFNPDNSSKRLNCRCAILTDDDRKETDISSRALRAKELEKNLLKVELAELTFEYELFVTGNNSQILINLFSTLHPKASEAIEKGDSVEEYAKNFIKKVESNKAKSELAHSLALLLQSERGVRKNFTVPTYIENAVKWVVEGINNV